MTSPQGVLETVFSWVWTASWQASVLALLVLLLQVTLGRWLNPRWRYALWLLVLARLLLPALPESAFSLFQFAPAPVVLAPIIEPAPIPLASPLPAPSFHPPSISPATSFSIFFGLAMVWAIGAFLLLLLTWQVNWKFLRQVAASPEIADPEILSLFTAAKKELGISRSIRLIESQQVQSPAIMGLFSPTLILPADVRDKFTAHELRLIFLHELAHLKRGDILAQAVIAALQIVHWFNPVLWFAFRRMRIDREPATDALVLSRTGEAEKENYGLVLIKLLEHFNQRHSLPTLVGVLEDKDQFKRRFSLIARFTRGAYGWSLLGVLLILVLSITLLTKSKVKSPEASEVKVSAKQDGPVMIQYKVSVIRIAESDYQKQSAAIDDAVQSGDISFLLHLPTASPLGMPQVLCQSGQQGVVEITRVLPFAAKYEKGADGKPVPTDFTKRNLGIRAVCLSDWANGQIQPHINVEVSNLDGWIGVEDHMPKPVIQVRSVPIAEPFAQGQTKGFAFPGGATMLPLDPTVVYNWDATSDASKNPKVLGRLFCFVTTTAYDANGKQLTGTSAPSHKSTPTPQGLTMTGAVGSLPSAEQIRAAIGSNDYNAVKSLLDQGAPLDARDMQEALRDGRQRIVALLWSHGPPHGCSELSYAISQDQPVDKIAELLKKGAPVTPPEDTLVTPLSMAAQRGNIPAAKLLLEHGADLHPSNPRLNPLDAAVGVGKQPEMVDFLLKQGATITDQTRVQAIIWSLGPGLKPIENSTKIMQQLIQAGGIKGLSEDESALLLLLACQKENPAILKELLDAGLSPSSRFKTPSGPGSTALEAIQKQAPNFDPEIRKQLLDLLGTANKSAPAKDSTTSVSPPPTESNDVQTAAKLSSLHLDLPAYSDAPLSDVIAQFSRASISSDPSRQGVNFVVPINNLRLTLPAMQNATALDALQAVAKAANVRYLVRDSAVYLQLPDANARSVRTYLVPPGFLQPTPDTQADVRSQLLAHGIAFGGDTSATYIPGSRKIVVRNTPDQLDKLSLMIEAAASTNSTSEQVLSALREAAKTIPPDHQRLQILQGFYGADGSWRDVTSVLMKSVQNNSLKISWQQPYVEIGGDPAYLKVKTLLVSYRLDGVDKVATFREENPPVGLQASLPPKEVTGATKPSDTVAIVDGHAITMTELQKNWQSTEDSLRSNYHGDDLKAKLAEMQKTVLNALVDRQLIIDEFKAQGGYIPASETEKRVDEIIKDAHGGDRQDFLQALTKQGTTLDQYKKEFEDTSIVGYMRNKFVEEPLQEFWQSHPELFPAEERFSVTVLEIKGSQAVEPGHLGDISAETDPQAKVAASALAALKAGSDISPFVSDGDSTRWTGKPVWFVKDAQNLRLPGAMPGWWPVQLKAFDKMKPGETTDIVISDFSYAHGDSPSENRHAYWMLRMNERRPASEASTATAQNQREQILNKKSLEIQEQWLASLRAKARIQIFDTKLVVDSWATEPMRAMPVHPPAPAH